MTKRSKIALANFIMSVYQKIFGKPRLIVAASCVFTKIAIYSTTALGDLMFNTPAIRQLRLRYPQAHLILVVHHKYRGLLENYTDVNQIMYWDGMFVSLFGFVRQLRREKIDLMVSLHSREPYDVMSAIFAGCSTILRDTYENDSSGMERWLAVSCRHFNGHVIQKKLNLLTVLGCRTDQTNMVPLCQVNRGRYRQTAEVRVGFQLGASKSERCWPVAYFVKLAEILLEQQPNLQIILLGSTQEKALECEFFALLDDHAKRQIQSLLGQTSVLDVFDAVASVDVLVTGDTGPLQVAIALKVRTVSLFVTANPAWTGPYQDLALHTVIYRPLNESAIEEVKILPMSNISPGHVFPHIIQTLYGYT